MNILGAIGLLLGLVAAAIVLLVQSLMILAFANDHSNSTKFEFDWRRRPFGAIAACLLAIGVLVPPVLFVLNISWTGILVTIAGGLGGCWLVVLIFAGLNAS